ncbi:unnamed protein product [Ectocarpus sp. 12 AP-2014]
MPKTRSPATHTLKKQGGARLRSGRVCSAAQQIQASKEAARVVRSHIQRHGSISLSLCLCLSWQPKPQRAHLGSALQYTSNRVGLSHAFTISRSHWPWLGWSSQFRGDTINKSAGRPTDKSKRGVCSILRCSLLCPLPPPP